MDHPVTLTCRFIYKQENELKWLLFFLTNTVNEPKRDLMHAMAGRYEQKSRLIFNKI